MHVSDTPIVSIPLLCQGSACLVKAWLAWSRHSLLGDYMGYGRFWTLALQTSQFYGLRHAGLIGNDAFTLSREGAMSMASKYACVAEMAFARAAFDLIGASFGAVLASHVAHAARANGACPRRLVLIDPPPAVPSELAPPKMLTR